MNLNPDHQSQPTFRPDMPATDQPPAEALFLGGGDNKRRISDTTVVLVGALILAGLVLGGMRWMAKRAPGSATDSTLEAKVDDFLKRLYGPTEAAGAAAPLPADILIDSLIEDRTTAQVPLDQVQKNPFRLDVETGQKLSPEDEEAQLAVQLAEQRRREAERRRGQLESIASHYTLTSIIGRKGQYTAMINGDVVRVGDVYDDTFTVTQIGPYSVVLEAEGFEFLLSLRPEQP